MTITFLLPAGISVLVSSLLVARGSRRLPQLPLVELAIVGVMVTTLLTFGFSEAGDAVPRWLVASAMVGWLLLLYAYPAGSLGPSWLTVPFAIGVAGIGAIHLTGADEGLLLAAFGIPFAIGAIGQVWRYRRRSSIRERQATKWVLVGLVPAVTVFLGIGVIASTTSLGAGVMEQDWYFVLSSAAIWLLPWCAAIGVLAPERGRADPVIHGLVIGCGSAFALAWAYFLASPIVGEPWAAAGTAALVLPVTWAMRRVATRLVYQRDPAPALAALGDRLERTPQPGDVAAVVAQTVVDGLAVPYAAVTLETGLSHVVGSRDAEDPEHFPVVHHGESVATIAVVPRHGELRLAAHDRAMLRRLASSAGPALHAAVMFQRLQAAREGLVLAREEERRRIRRDLHDDLAPTLAALGFNAASAAALLERDAARARILYDQLQTEIATAVGRVRDIAYDLRPPILDDLGLMAAIRDRVAAETQDAPRIEVNGEIDEERVPAAVQLAALRIVQEAVSNVRRHASAQSCDVDLTTETGWLVVRVTDDGTGLTADAARGVGLRSMEERATELGGHLSLDSGAGTTIEARLPLGGPVA